VDWQLGANLGNLAVAMMALFTLFAVAWIFVAFFRDILRRDLSGWAKAGWIALIVLVPLLGALAYVVVRPRDVVAPARGRDYRPADEIATAARLYEKGTVTAGEFEYLKRKALMR
jgi:hypothetical protein